ncbi:carbohydrate porin [Endozoicomonas sp. ALB115]|uniref:carbohydrate porin n=1 Tax=Endozoicomonas sp. ALB115 TaxID=3403074 RepID=UPI003BB7E397
MFGRKDSWAFQIGRYEAMNLFPLGKDVALFYADGADSIGSGIYYYMAKEGRGRGGDAGQARIIGEMGNWTAEVSTVYGDTESVLENSSEYLQGVVDIDSSHNSFMVRPAVNYLSDDGFFSISFGGEYEVNGDYVTATNTVTKENLNFLTATVWQPPQP